jgi:hypothetical protein
MAFCAEFASGRVALEIGAIEPNFTSRQHAVGGNHDRRSNAPNEAIYERAGVKRGGADFVSRASRTSPSPSASVDLADLNPVRGRVGRATRNTSSEPEAEGEYSPSVPVVFEALADVT